MYNITLICTIHGENGNCNINELYKIIEKINPEIIFEEIPPSAFDDFYIDKSINNLETDAIIKYLESHQVKHIPIDYDYIPEKFFADNEYMHRRIKDISSDYRRSIDTHSSYVKEYGFKYLNSIYCNNIYNEIYNAMENALNKIDNNKLFQTYISWNDLIEKRETEMIKNIYSYSKEHILNTGLFFIGAAHRESIINKIENHSRTECVKINWNYSNYENIL